MKSRLLPPLAAAASLALLTILAIAMLVAPPLVTNAHSDVLWDQSTVDPMGPGYFNSISGLPPMGSTMYAVGDIQVGAEGWVIQSISETFTAIDPNWGTAISQGKLVLFPKTGSLPASTNNPANGTIVPMTGTLVTGERDNFWVVTASGLNLVLEPGEYWIGITPNAPSGFFGPEIQLSSTVHFGDDSPWYDPYGANGPIGWSVPSAGYDMSLLINGMLNTPVPTARQTWGAIKNLYR